MKKLVVPVLFLIYIIILIICIYVSYHPNQKQLNVSVKLEITGRGYYNFDRGARKHDDYFSKLTVTNNEAKPVSFWMMSCSMWDNTLRFNTDSIEFSAWGCDKNIPVEVELKSGKSIVFYPVFHDNSIYRLAHDYYVDSNNVAHPAFPAHLKDNNQVRIGFTMMRNVSKYPNGRPPELVKSGETYWSNRVSLRFRNNGYRIEE
jgi:hypothetical protein